MVAPIAGAAWQAKGRAALRDRALWVAVLVPGLVTVAWYAHAFMLYRQTGITFGILVHPARTYPLDIAPGPWKYAFSKWSSVALLMRGDFYLTLLSRLYEILLLPWGFAGALLGATMWKRDGGPPGRRCLARGARRVRAADGRSAHRPRVLSIAGRPARRAVLRRVRPAGVRLEGDADTMRQGWDERRCWRRCC